MNPGQSAKRILYLWNRHLTESPNATEVQLPLGLARAFNVTMLVPRGTFLPAQVKERMEFIEITRLVGTSRMSLWERLVFLHEAAKRTGELDAGGNLDLICTPIDEASLLLGSYLARRYKKPWVVFCWDHPYPIQAERTGFVQGLLRWSRSTLLRVVIRHASLLVLFIHPGLIEALRLRPQNVLSIPNGVDIERLEPIRRQSRPRDQLLGIVAYVSASKGTPLALQALHEIRKVHPEARLRLIGDIDGHSLPSLNAQMKALGLEGAVELCGAQPYERAMALAAECSVMLHVYPPLPRFYWNYVLKIGEYLALGKPVVAVDTPGTRAYIREGENGFLTPPGDPEAIAEAVCRLLSDHDLARAMGQAALKVAKRHDWQVIHRSIDVMLSSLMPKSSSSIAEKYEMSKVHDGIASVVAKAIDQRN